MSRRFVYLLIVVGLLFGASTPALADDPPPPDAGAQVVYKVYMPLAVRGECLATGESYGTLSLLPPPTDRPAEQHGDLNLGLPGYEPTTAYLGLVDYGGSTDDKAPQLYSLFGDNRTPAFVAAFQIHYWIWTGPWPDPGHQGDVIDDWPVTLLGMGVSPGELIRVPFSGYDIGSPYEVMVLYAASNRITLSYTRSDSIAFGYAIYAENICVDPNLVALYQARNAAGRSSLPALRAGQPFARAVGSEIDIAIRDQGAFFDPRSRKDWWKGR